MALTDHYVLGSWVFLLMLVATGLYFTRTSWAPLVEPYLSSNTYSRLNPSSFEEDLEAGLSSDNFSLASNIVDGDARSGLDVTAKREVLSIMKSKRVDFDTARRMYLEQKMAKNGVAPDGRPTDPRAVFFS